MSDFLTIIALSTFGGVMGLAGGLVFLMNKKVSKSLTHIAIPFAAGVLITTSLVHLIPESVEASGHSAMLFVLGAFFASFFFEEFFANMHHHEGHHHSSPSHGSVPLILFGDSIHNFIDGVAIAASYMISPELGIIVAIATFLHEIPHEIGDFGLLLSSGWSKKNTILANLFSALTTLVGATITFLYADFVQPSVGIMLAISAGVFLYLGASDFLPELTGLKGRGRKSIWLFIMLGVLVILGMTALIPEH